MCRRYMYLQSEHRAKYFLFKIIFRYIFRQNLIRQTKNEYTFLKISTLSSSKLGLAAGSSALSPPEMLFRTWGGGQGGHCTQRTRPRGVGADCKTASTSQPDLSRLKLLTPARARRLGAEKTSPERIWVLDFKQGGREIGISHLPRARPSYFLLRPWLSRD